MRSISLALLSLAVALPTFAADGRSEINQASVDAAGGFPFGIDAPGSYVLTSDLTVPADTHGVLLFANDVSFDLNGFSITGPATCDSGSCTTGSSAGVGFANISTGRRATVRNGTIRGFSGTCVSLRNEALVEGLVVTQCGVHGISALGGSVVLRNRVGQVGLNGISMIATNPPPTYAHNTVSAVSLGVAGFFAVQGGRASAGNSCDDGSCSPNGQRRYYLTGDSAEGGSAAAACALGFRVAAIGEMLDPTGLHYEPNLGFPTTAGPPQDALGWLTVTNQSNCTSYTQTLGTGRIGRLTSQDTHEFANFPPWIITGFPCTSTAFVWCIEQ